MKTDFLLEILVQELPYRFIPDGVKQLEAALKGLLCDKKIEFGKVETYATPRRLGILIENIENKSQDVILDIKGPNLSIALDDSGNYTNAALGFAKKNGISPDGLYQKDGYIFAKIQQKGKSAKEILEENLEAALAKLQGAHFMRWGYFEDKFSRPVENLLALFGQEVLSVSFFGKKAVNKTKGHRFSKITEVVINNPKEYVQKLKEANVFVLPQERKERIINLSNEAAKKVSCTVDFENYNELLDEVTYITEYPVPVVCEFKKEYLDIPDIVTVTVMSKHQRYFPLYEKNGLLSNKFIAVSNFVGCDDESFENIKKGNQRVISARLEDGKFFYAEDIKTSLEEKIKELKGMTFQRGLGNLYDKTCRIEKISSYLLDELKIDDKKDTLRTAKLCKADLASKLVFEFTELEGFIGENYALKFNENKNVALGIKEHYFPLSSNSKLPSAIEGQIVSIADKIDTICAVFLSTQNEKKKKRPTGSNDPLGIRRAAVGILKTIIDYKLEIDLYKLIDEAISLISKEFDIKVEAETKDEIADFIYSRLNVLYEKTFNSSVMGACKGNEPLSNLTKWLVRVKNVQEFVEQNSTKDVLEAINRVLRITKNEKQEGGIEEKLFVEQEEKDLYQTFLSNKDVTYQNISKLSAFVEPLNSFFDKVLVMDKDEAIKRNRINLLKTISLKFNSICDFSKIVIKQV